MSLHVRAFRHTVFPVLLALSLGTAPAVALETLAILPAKITLTGPEARQALLVERVVDGRFVGQVADGVELTSSDPNVARVVDDVVIPAGNGRTTITATHDGMSASAEVEVVRFDAPHEWSFRNHVQSVFAKMGCNSGACHGALAGKGGFKLSLRGYDPLRDFRTITREARGRRVELADPGRSLILAKPSGAIPHKGGLRFDVDSLEYRVISEWIIEGAKAPGDEDASIERLEILPEAVTLAPGASQQMLVRAHFSDGHVEDVTRWAKFTATNESVAAVDENGRVSIMGPGEGAVTAWYASKIVVARIALPYPNQVDPQVFAEAPRRNFIDELVIEKLRSLNLPPSPPASDEEFLRRAYLDTIGTLPTAEEARAFLADDAAERRDRLIDALLTRPEFVDYWSYRWSDVLLVNGRLLRPKAVEAYYQWIRGEVRANTPWDELVRKIVTATGGSYENGATNFYALHQDPENMSENVSQAFLGLSIACAKCHNHPLEKWTNDQYYGMANLFARVRAKGWGGDFRSGDGQRTLYVVEEGELIQPLSGKPQPPAPLDGAPVPFDDASDRRVHLAEWLTSPENPYFSRSIANRVWANFFGVGLVEAVDDMRTSNPASNEKLLSAAADHLVENDFDLKALMRAILRSATYQRSSSATYQRSSVPLPENEAETRYYSRYYPKRLMAEVLLDAISQVTGVPSDFNQIEYPGGDKQKTDQYPKGTRALQLADAAVASYFLDTFGRNQRAITCECERSDEPSIVQVLHIANGDTVNQKLAAEGSCVNEALAAKMETPAIIERAYLSALSRYPTDRERAELAKLIEEAGAEDRKLLIEDLYWSILSSREFLFNH